MEPLMSAKSIVTVLRSPSSDVSEISAPTHIDVPASDARPNLPASSSGFAHSMQNLVVREFSVRQEGQWRVNGDAHSPQNFAWTGFSAPHFEQRIGPSPRLELCRPYACYITLAICKRTNGWL